MKRCTAGYAQVVRSSYVRGCVSVDFINSNIFTRLFDETNLDNRQGAETLVKESLRNSIASISFLVIQETLNILACKLAVTPTNGRHFMYHVLAPLRRIMPS